MKRFVPVLAAVLMAFVLPLTAFARVPASQPVYDDTDLHTVLAVDLTGIAAPAVGELPSYNVTLPAGAGYIVDYSYDGNEYYIKNGVQWNDPSGPVPFDQVFRSGVSYTVYVFLKAKTGNVFGEDYTVAVTVNGETADSTTDPVDNRFLTVNYQFPAPQVGEREEILSVVFSGSVKYGTPLGPNTITTSSAGIASARVRWLAGEEELDPGTPAVAGEYSVLINVTADELHVLTTETVFKALGSGGVPYYVSENGDAATYIAKVNVKCEHKDNENAYSYDSEHHELVCSVCGETVESGPHDFDEGVDSGTETVFTCKTCGYHYSTPHGTTGKISVTIPSFHAGSEYGDIMKAVKVSFENGEPKNVVFTFTAGESVDVVIYSVSANTYMLPGGGDVSEALERAVEPYAPFSLAVEIEPGLAASASDVTVAGGPDPDVSVSGNGNIIITMDYGAFSHVISKLELSSVPKLKMGEKPTSVIKVVTSGAVAQKVEWTKDGASWKADEKARCTSEYVAKVTFKAEDGLVFAPELTVSPAAEVLDVNENTAVIAYRFGGGKHSFGKWQTVTSAKEGVEGKKMRKCSACGEIEYMTVPALEHTHKYVQKSDENGHWTECSCGDKTELQAHEWGEWTTVTEPQVGVQGEKERSCSVCGYKESETIPELDPPHTHIYGLEYDDSYHWGVCECGDETEREEHEFDENGVCKECGYEKVNETSDVSAEEPFSEQPGQESAEEPSETAASREISEPEISDRSGKVGLIIALIFVGSAAIAFGLWYYMKKKNVTKA